MKSESSARYWYGAIALVSAASGCSRSPELSSTVSDDALRIVSAAGEPVIVGFRMTPDPPRSGDNGLTISLTKPDGTAIPDATVSAVFYMPAMPSMGMPEMRSVFDLTNATAGEYAGTGNLVMAGTWDVTIRISRDGKPWVTAKRTVIAK